MNNTLKFVKKGVSIAVTSTTILWSVGIGTLAPLATHAAQPGQLIKKADLNTVYYLGSDSKRYVFPNPTTYFSWYSDFSGVVTVSSSELESYQLGGNVTIRPGTKLVKITTDARTYAVEPGGQLRHIATLDIATTLYGANVWKMVVDVPDYFFTNYKASTNPISTNTYPTATLIKSATGTDVYYVDGTTKRKVTTAGLTGNMLNSSNVVIAPDSVFNALTSGTDIAAQESTIWNVQGGATTGPVSTGTGLTVALASDTPSLAVHASGTSYNPALKINLTAAADGAVNVTSLTLKRLGVSIDGNIAGVGVFDPNGVRHGNFVTFSENVATISMTTDPIVVPAGQTISVMVKTNVTAHTTAGAPANAPNSGTYALQVLAASSVGTTATVTGSFPITGAGFSYISGFNIVGSVTLDAVLVHSNGTNDATAVNVNLGTTDQVIGKFRLMAGSPEDINVSSITIYNNGNSSDGDVTNIDLVAPDGTILGTVAKTTNRYATFNLATPYLISKGNTRDLTIRADVVGGSTRTVRFLISNNYDIVAVGKDTSSGILPTAATTVDGSFPIGDSSGGAASCAAAVTCINKVTIAAGTLLFAKSGDSPSGNIAAGASNIVFGKWDATAQGEDMEIQQIDYTPTYSAATLTGTVYFKVNGTTVYSVASGSLPATTVAAGSTSLSSYYTIKQGVKATVTVEGSIISTASAGSTVAASLDIRTVKRIATNDIVDPSVALTAGNTLTVSTAALSVAKNSSFANPTIVAGQAEAKVGSFNMTASSTEPVGVSSITVGITTNAGGLSNLMLKDGTTQLGSTLTSPAASNVVSITGFTIPAGTTKNIDVYLTTNSTATGTDSTTITAVSATGANSSVTVSATGLTATGQTVTFSSGGTLTIAQDSTNSPVAQILHSGLVDQTLLAVRLSANNAEDIKITTLQVSATSGATTLQNLKLYYNAAQIGTTTQLSNGTASFSGISLVVPKDSSITVYVKGSTTASGTLASQSVVNLSVDHITALGVSGGSTLNPGSSLSTACTTCTGAVAGGALVVSSTAGFHDGDVILLQDTTGGGALGVITAEPTSTTGMTVSTLSAIVSSGTGAVNKIETGATTNASVGTSGGVLTSVQYTVTNTSGFSAGDPVIIAGATTAQLGYVVSVDSGVLITIRAISATATGTAAQISKIGTATLSTTATAAAILVTTASVAQAVTSTSGFNVGDLVLIQDTATAGTFGVVTAVGSTTSMSIITNAAMTTAATATVVRIGSANASTTLVTTAGSAGARATAITTATTVTSTTGFAAGDVVVTVGGATGGAILGRVGAITSSVIMTIGSVAADATLVSRVTRLPGAAAAGNALTIHDVEPVITVNSASPSGSATAGSGKVVGIFDVKADGDRNMNITSVNVQTNGSNLPWNYVTTYDLYNGAQLLASASPMNRTVTGAGGFALNGSALNLCSAAPSAVDELNIGAAGVTEAATHISVNDSIVVFLSATNYFTAKVTANVAGTACTGAVASRNLTLSNYSLTGAVITTTSAVSVKSFNVYFDSTSSTPLASQTITAGATLPLTVKADTTSVKNTVTTGTVNYNVNINGTTGSTGGLTWNYTPSGGTQITNTTVSDSYPVNGGTLVY